MNDDQSKMVREQLIQVMRGDQSHLGFDAAIQDFPFKLAGAKVEGAPHTAWQLLEHLRIALHDIFEFSQDPHHKSPKWPDDYWPKSTEPPDEHAWKSAIAAYRQQQKAMDELIADPSRDLFKPIEGGSGQTLLREALVAAAHNSYHLGQLVFLKKILTQS